jgi:uncharacterized lipoprotein NlpE involved in copper resistance
MSRKITLVAIAAAAALAGCNNQSQAEAEAANQAANEAANANVKLPPAIVGSHKYRCKDNSLLAIDWLSDGTENSARVTPEGGAAMTLAQAEAGGPYAAEGVSLTGGPQVESITFKGQSCKR